MDRKHVAFLVAHCPDSKSYLMGKRASENHFGEWDFFGGNVNPHELPRTALLREVIEETNITPHNAEYVGRIATKKKTINIYWMECSRNIIDDIIKLNSEHSEHGWFTQESFPSDLNNPARKIVNWLMK